MGPFVTIREAIRAGGYVTAVIGVGPEPDETSKVGQFTVKESEWPMVAALLQVGAADVFERHPDRPLLLLDVDGVLNHVGQPQKGDRRFLGRTNAWAPEGIAEHVRTLAARFEVWWCTAWEWNANAILSATWNLPKFDWITVHHLIVDRPGWKWPAVKAWMDTYGRTRPVVWVDDDISGLPTLTRQEMARYPGFMLKPINNRQGLRLGDVEKLLAWAEELQTKEDS